MTFAGEEKKREKTEKEAGLGRFCRVYLKTF